MSDAEDETTDTAAFRWPPGTPWYYRKRPLMAVGGGMALIAAVVLAWKAW